jgi:glycine/sarcosine N-methyltransferase
MKPNEPDSVLKFYQDLASEYHHIFADWKQSVLWQGEVLDGIIRAALGKQPASLLDCTCGIGTQAIGRSRHAYHGSAGAGLI